MDILIAILGFAVISIGFVAPSLRVVKWLFSTPPRRIMKLKFGYLCFCIFWLTTAIIPIYCFIEPVALQFLPSSLVNLLCFTLFAIASVYVFHLTTLIDAKVETNAAFNRWIQLDVHERHKERAMIEVIFREYSQKNDRFFDRHLGWDEEYLTLKFLLKKIDAYNRLSSDEQSRVRVKFEKYNDLHNLSGRIEGKIFNTKF